MKSDIDIEYERISKWLRENSYSAYCYKTRTNGMGYHSYLMGKHYKVSELIKKDDIGFEIHCEFGWDLILWEEEFYEYFELITPTELRQRKIEKVLE